MVARAGRRERGRPGKFLAGLIDDLVEWATVEFKRNRKTSSGATEGEIFESAARQLTLLGKQKIAALIDQEGPPFPEPLGYLWLWFSQHSMGLAATGMSYPVITWEGLWAWSQLLRIDLEPWEVDLVMNLSCIRANVHAEQMNEKRKADR